MDCNCYGFTAYRLSYPLRPGIKSLGEGLLGLSVVMADDDDDIDRDGERIQYCNRERVNE